MNRFEQRMRRRLQNPEVAAGYREMAAERALLQCLEEIREQQHITKEELATRMGKHREAVSRLLNASDANPTLETLMDLLMALGITAEITLRPAIDGEEPIKVARAS
jgi:transcriptional regulator with XRE-family HTH domain